MDIKQKKQQWILSMKKIKNAFNTLWQSQEIGKHYGRITKVKPFINGYNWEGINFPREKDDWKKFKKNNATIAFNVSHAKKEKVYLAYVSKHNSNREKQVIILMTSNGEGWLYITVKKLPALLREITSKYHVVFFVWIFFILLQEETNGNLIKKCVKENVFVVL